MGPESLFFNINQLRQVFRDTKANLDALTGLRDGALGYGTDTAILYRQNGAGAANWEAIGSVSAVFTVLRDTKANLDALTGLLDGDLAYATDDTLLYRQLGAGAANWEAVTAAGGAATFVELDGSVNTTAAGEGLGDGAWGTWDISGSLPAGTFEVDICVQKLVATDNIGLRKDGSALVRTFAALKLQELYLKCEVSAARKIAIMSADVSDADVFRLMGYRYS